MKGHKEKLAIKFVNVVKDHFPGEKNGKEIGMMLFTAVSAVKINFIWTFTIWDKQFYNFELWKTKRFYLLKI